MARNINELNLVGSTGSNRRVQTIDGPDAQEITVTYPRPSNALATEEKARFASLAAKGLAHLGFSGASQVHSFAQELFAQSESEAAEATAAAEAPCTPEEIVVNGVMYVKA